MGYFFHLLIVTKIWLKLGEEYAKSRNILFFETSAKEDTNVNELFKQVAAAVYEKLKAGILKPDVDLDGVKENFDHKTSPNGNVSIEHGSSADEKKSCCVIQ